MIGGQQWPKFTIVTPSYNQALYLEEAIRSVLLQGYPNLEYVVVDGGSTDGSEQVIRKYEPWLNRAIVERDSGQSEAINKGIAKATGEWANWLNSDDYLLPGALETAVNEIVNVGEGVEIACFACDIVNEKGEYVGKYDCWEPKNIAAMLKWKTARIIPQPSTFVRTRSVYVDETLHFAMDWDLYMRTLASRPHSIKAFDKAIAAYRMHPATKSSLGLNPFIKEGIKIVERLPIVGFYEARLRDKWLREAKRNVGERRRLYYGLRAHFHKILGMKKPAQ